MAILVDVPFAVAVFLIPNILSNAWQTWSFRNEFTDRRFALTFAMAGFLGAGIGTIALAKFSGSILLNAVALVVLAYVAFRLVNPEWVLSKALAEKLVGPIGAIGGFFQGALGLSGPVAVTFMNAVGLPRPTFIFTMSLYFLAMTMIQLPVQLAFGVMTTDRFVLGILASIPLAIGMVLGELLARHISRRTFDRIIVGVLLLLALRLLAENFL